MEWFRSTKPRLLVTDEFSIIKDITITPDALGRGSYATVYTAEYDGKPCAAKVMHPFIKRMHQGHQNTSTPLEMFYNEINTLSTLKHPSIVQFLGVYFRPKDKSHAPILVMERMWKNLSNLLEEQPNRLPLLIKTSILYDVACGLQYLHGQKKPVVHCDFNANNVMLTENLEAKIIDLGQAKALDAIAGLKLSTTPGNTAHMPPEVLKHKPTYDCKLDIFSFGCTALHAVTEKFPMPTDQFVQPDSDQTAFVRVSEIERRKEYIELLSSKGDYYPLQQIIIQCLQNEPTSRPTASDIRSELEKQIKNKSSETYQDKLSLIQSLHVAKNEVEHAKLAKQEYLKVIDNLKTETQSLQKTVEEQKESNRKLVETYTLQIDKMNSDLKTYQKEVRSAHSKYTELQTVVHELQISLNEAEEKCSLANSKLQEAENNKQLLLRETVKYKTQLSKLQKKLNVEQNRIKTITQKCVEKDEEIESLKKIKVDDSANSKTHVITQTFVSYTSTDHEVCNFHRLNCSICTVCFLISKAATRDIYKPVYRHNL